MRYTRLPANRAAEADQAHEHWALNFENIGDPHQEISKICSERGWLDALQNRGSLEFLQSGVDWEIEHPKGFFQPGVLAFDQRAAGAPPLAFGAVEREFKRDCDAANAHSRMGKYRAEPYGWRLGWGCSHDDSPEADQRPPPRIFLLQPLLQTAGLLSPNLSPTG